MTQIPLMAGLSAVEQARLLGKLDRVFYPQNSFIFMQNEPGDCMYLLSKGQVEVFVSSDHGNQSVGTIGEGETFGEINLLLDQPRSATIMATTDVELLVIGREVFNELITTHASIANYFTKLLSSRLIQTNQSLIAYKHAQHQIAATVLSKLPAHLRKIVLFSGQLPDPSIRLLGEYFDEADLADQLAAADEAGQLYTVRDDRIELGPTTREVVQTALAAEADPLELEHLILTFVELYIEAGRLGDAVRLLIRSQQWQEACFLFDRWLRERARPADGGRPEPASDADAAGDPGAELLDACPVELLLGSDGERVLFFYLDAKLEEDARHGLVKTEALLHGAEASLSEELRMRLYEYAIAFCDRLGFEQKALEYIQVLSGLQQSAAAGAASTAAAAAGAPEALEARKRRLMLAKLQVESAKQLRHVGDARQRAKRGAGIAARALTVIAVAAIVGVFAWLAPPEGLDRGGMLFIGITLSAICLWMVNIIPDYLVSLFMCMTWVVAGLAEPAVALSGFSNPVWLFIILALLLGAAVASTGLMYRLSLHLMRVFPKTYRGQLLGIAAAGLTLNPLIPSGMTKVMLALPLTTSAAESLGYAKRSSGSAGLVLAGLLFFGYSTPFFLTAGIGNFLALGLLPGYHVSFLEWTWYALPAFLIYTALILGGVLLLFRAEPPRRTVTDELVREQLGMLGPITRPEKQLLGTLIAVVGLQLLQPLHGIAGVWVMLLAVAALILLRVLDKPAIRQSVDLSILLHLGVAIGFSSVATELGVAGWFSEKLLVGLAPLTFSPYVFLPVLVLLIFGLSLFVYSTPAMLLLTVALLPLFESLQYSPWILIFIVLLSVDPFLLPYQSEVYLAAYYGTNELGFTHAQGRRAGLLYCAAVLLLVMCSIPFWQTLGLISF